MDGQAESGQRHQSFDYLLRTMRIESGLTQEDLAERSGLSVRGISDIERGLITTPLRSTVDLLAQGLGLSEAERMQLNEVARAGRRTPSGSIGNLISLPRPTTSFVGREAEMETIGNRLIAGGRTPDHVDGNGRCRQDEAGDRGGGPARAPVWRWRVFRGSRNRQ
jgi:transcriptional regulator with XRE-family HTH domain